LSDVEVAQIMAACWGHPELQDLGLDMVLLHNAISLFWIWE
jgi:hypothetical protein